MIKIKFKPNLIRCGTCGASIQVSSGKVNAAFLTSYTHTCFPNKQDLYVGIKPNGKVDIKWIKDESKKLS